MDDKNKQNVNPSKRVKNAKKDKSERKRVKYSAEYISYVEHGDSAVVFITRDIVNAINTNDKWVDVVDSDGRKVFIDYDEEKGDDKYGWDFEWFIVELFPRRTEPDYSLCLSDEDKKYETWATANDDIVYWKIRGYKGERFKVRPQLVRINKAEKKPKANKVKVLFDKSLQMVVSENLDPNYEYIELEIEQDVSESGKKSKSKWEYHILSVEKLGKK